MLGLLYTGWIALISWLLKIKGLLKNGYTYHEGAFI